MEYRGAVLALLTRLKQICDHPALLEDATGEPAASSALDRRSGKCERLIDMLERRGIISGYEGSKPRRVLVSETELHSV